MFSRQFGMRFYRAVVEHPGWWVGGWLLLLALLVSALAHTSRGFSAIPFHDGPYRFFRADNPDFQALRTMEATFASDKSLVILLTPQDGNVFTPAMLGAIEAITEEVWTLPYVVRVDSISNFQHAQADGDELVTDNLYTDGARLDTADIARVRSIALQEKSLLKRLLAEDGSATAIVANVLMDDEQKRSGEIMAAAHEFRDRVHARYPFLTVALVGDAPATEAAGLATQQSLTQTTPIAMTLVLGFLFLLLRNVFSVIVSQLTIFLSIGFAYVIFLLLGNGMSPIAAMSSPMILTLAVADCVHLLVTYHQQCGKGLNKQQAMIESLRINFEPVWLTSSTTALGFLLMNFAESPPFHDLGNAVFIGVMAAFALSVTFLPALMMLLPIPHYRFGSSQTRYMHALARFTIRWQRPLLVGVTAVALLCVSFIPLNRVNDIFNEYYDDTFEVRRALDRYLTSVGGLQKLQFAVPAAAPGAVMEPDYLRQLDAFVQWVETQPRVSHVSSFVDVVKRLNRNMHGGDEAYYAVPEERELIAQLVLMYELGLPFGLALDSQVDLGRSVSKVEVVFERIRSDDLVQERERMNAWIASHWPAYMQTRATGLDSLFGDISFQNVTSMLTGTVFALVLISALLAWSLRSWRYGLLSLVPNLLPALVAFGIWGLWVSEIGLVASVLGCMTLGIIVDDTVHLLSKYVRAKRELGLDSEAAVEYALQTVGVSLIATTVVLVANFAVMGLSHYAPNVTMGVLTSMIISIALVLDFFLFVPLLLVVDRRRVRAASPVSETAPDSCPTSA